MTDNFNKALPYLEPLSVFELLRVHRWTLRRLKALGVIRSFNQPQGEWAEMLVKEAYNGELAAKSNAGYDVIDEHKKRLEVKTRVLEEDTTSLMVSDFRKFNFDKLVLVQLNGDDLRVKRAVMLSVNKVKKIVGWDKDKEKNRYRMRADDATMRKGKKVTDSLQMAAEVLNRRHSINKL